jgi:hypothetical protein
MGWWLDDEDYIVCMGAGARQEVVGDVTVGEVGSIETT